MREDMFKVIVERPRWGMRNAKHGRKRLAGMDDLPMKIGVKRHVAITQSSSKWLNENLRPLERYLGRQVGRVWNDVYSEICATLSPGHTVKEHVRQHLDDFVLRRIKIGRNGEWLYAGEGWYRGKEVWRQRYYVDPVDGVLKDSDERWKKLGLRPPRCRRKATEKNDPDVRVIDAKHEYRRIEGIWYEVTYDRKSSVLPFVFDVVSRVEFPSSTKHAVAKRQLARIELKSLGLANGPNN